MKLKFNLMMFILFILLIPNVLSHLDAGQDKVIDNYQIDFGYSPENPQISDNVAIALTLFNNTNQEVIEPESVWVRISSSKNVIFAGTLKPLNGNIAFTFKFPEVDDYEVLVRFNQDKKALVETNFNLKIKGPIISTSKFTYLIISILVLIIILIVLLYLKSLKNQSRPS